MVPPTRIATVVLVTPDGALVGALPPFAAATPWWQDARALVEGVRERHRVEITVLRLLSVDAAGDPAGDRLTYLAELATPIVAAPWPGQLDDHPLRQPWAQPGGPARDLAWADAALAARGFTRTGPATQILSWHLSSVWRLPVAGGAMWLKAVPGFMAPEGRVLAALAGGPVPRLVAADDHRALTAEVGGDDQYLAEPPRMREMIDLLVTLQATWIGRTAELLAIGVADWRPAALVAAIAAVIERTAPELAAADRGTLAGLVRGLDARLAAATACGVPDSLVHGDFHPGNLRGTDTTLAVLDWADCGVGSPLLDQPAFLERAALHDRAELRASWERAWTRVVPDSDPARAARLLAPIGIARRAAAYQRFLDRIEPAERPYHDKDVASALARAARVVRGEPDAAAAAP
jgi:hypothetical protein